MKAVLDSKHQVIGIECAPLGVEAFFNENNIEYQIENDENTKCQIYKVYKYYLSIIFIYLFRVIIFR